jgi:hypothetical protein
MPSPDLPKSRANDRWPLWLLLGGIALLLAAAALLAEARGFVAGATRVDGEVVALAKSRNNTRPVVRFRDAAGAQHEFRSHVSSATPSYDVGERVTVVHAPGRPDQARIADFESLYLLPALLGGLGAVLSAVGAAQLLRRRGRAA